MSSSRTNLHVSVDGRIAGQGSKNKARWGGTYEASKYLPAWRAEVKQAVVDALLANPAFNTEATGYSAVLLLWFRRPNSHFVANNRERPLRPDAPHYCATTPDVDKCSRAVLDALTQSGAIPDDRLVVHLIATKVYTKSTRPVPGMDLLLEAGL